MELSYIDHTFLDKTLQARAKKESHRAGRCVHQLLGHSKNTLAAVPTGPERLDCRPSNDIIIDKAPSEILSLPPSLSLSLSLLAAQAR